jgi:hypothetical protein
LQLAAGCVREAVGFCGGHCAWWCFLDEVRGGMRMGA